MYIPLRKEGMALFLLQHFLKGESLTHHGPICWQSSPGGLYQQWKHQWFMLVWMLKVANNLNILARNKSSDTISRMWHIQISLSCSPKCLRVTCHSYIVSSESHQTDTNLLYNTTQILMSCTLNTRLDSTNLLSQSSYVTPQLPFTLETACHLYS